MPVTAISPGPVIPISQSVIYALPGSPCVITTGVACERASVYTGPFTAWAGSTSGAYNHVGGFVRCQSGNTTIQALKVKMDGTTGGPIKLDPLYTAKVVISGASNYWPLNDAVGSTIARDIIGGTNGTISGGVTLNQSGVGGSKAMTFDGVNGKIVTAGTVALLTPFTIEAWIRSTSPVGEPGIYATRNAPSDAGQFVTAVTAVGSVFVYTNSGGSGGTLATFLRNGSWRHVVMILDGTATALFYVDGVNYPVSPLSSAYGSGSSTHVFEVGHDSGGPTYWPGQLQDVAIYPRALSAAEIAQHYSARLA